MRKFTAALAIVLASCSPSADTKLAEQAVPRFHEMLDAGQFEAIYEASASELKQAATKQDFMALLEAVHRKLGITRSTSQRGWNINFHTSGTFVTLNYATVYAEGDAGEQFIYKIEGNAALLAGYHINSNALILK